MQIICIANQKGGAGKTTLTYNVGCMLGDEFNKRVLMVDVDGQANLTTTLDFDPDELSKPVSALLTRKDAVTKDYVVSTKFRNVDLIPSTQSTFAAEKEILNVVGREFVLSRALDQVRDDYDVVLIDIPPNLGVVSLNALIASNGVVLVYTASEFALDGLSQILAAIDEIQDNSHININKLKILGFVQNRFKSSNKVVNSKIKNILEGVPDVQNYFTAISDTTEIEKSQFDHLPMHLFNRNHKVVDQFRQLVKELLVCLA